MSLRTLAMMAAALCLAGAAYAQPTTAAPEEGATFQCSDGTKMVLSFVEAGDSVAAKVWVHGASWSLPYLPPEPGPVQVAWSDGEHSLTWSPGVRLLWMAANTHLMCGRTHQH